MWEAIQSNKRKSVVLIGLLAVVLIALGYFAGAAFDPEGGGFGLLTAVGLWFILMAIAFAGGTRILLATSGAREVTREQAPTRRTRLRSDSNQKTPRWPSRPACSHGSTATSCRAWSRTKSGTSPIATRCS